MTQTAPASSQARPPTGAGTARRHANPALILLIIAGAQMMVVLDGTIVNIALPSMGEYFDKSQTDMTWALNAYTLAFGGLLLLGGRAGDLLGRRRMFITGLALFTLGSFLAGVSANFSMLLTGRVVQGLGGAIASPTALSLITTEFEEGHERNRAIGVYAAVSGAGAALGLLLGGILTNYFSWRWVLFVSVPIGLLLIAGAYAFLNRSQRLSGRFDLVGALLSIAGMTSLVYGFIHVAHSGWSDTESVAVLSLAVVLLVGFVLYEAYLATEPMMPMRIFEERNRAGTYVVMLVVGAAMFGMFYFITFFVQLVRDYGPLKTGVAFLPVALVIGVVSQVAAKLLGRIGPKPLMVTGTALLTIALLWLSRVDASSGYPDMLLPAMLVLGVAMGCLFVPLTATAVSKVRSTDAGLASALLNVGQQIGGTLGLSVMTTVFGTAARNYAVDHQGGLRAELGRLPAALRQPLAERIQSAGGNSLQPEQIRQFLGSLPASQRGPAASFFAGPYRDFGHHLLAHASGEAFLLGSALAVVALIAAAVLINLKRSDLPAEPQLELAGV